MAFKKIEPSNQFMKTTATKTDVHAMLMAGIALVSGLVVISAFGISAFAGIVSLSAPVPNCQDTDVSENPFVFGTVSVKNANGKIYTYGDYCTASGVQVDSCSGSASKCGLVQRTCAASSTVGRLTTGVADFAKICPLGCIAGACIQAGTQSPLIEAITPPIDDTSSSTQSESEKLIGVTWDFETYVAEKALVSWRWATGHPELLAGNYALIKSVSDAYSGSKALELTVKKEFPYNELGDNGMSVVSVINGDASASGNYFLPPETDIIRVHMKVVEGEFRFFINNESIFSSSAGNVYCSEQVVKPAADGGWQTVDFAMYNTLGRDHYVYAFSINDKAPIYSTRYYQHNYNLSFATGSYGKVIIDKMELISKGKSKPYPIFKPEQVQTISKVYDFENNIDLGKMFTLYMSDNKSFSLAAAPPAKITGTDAKNDRAAVLSVANDTLSNSNVLQYTRQFNEELSYVGFPLPQSSDANALKLKLYMKDTSGKTRNLLPMDFLIFVAADKTQAAANPFKAFETPLAWQTNPLVGYKYAFGSNMAATVPFAIYQARRGVKNGEWNELVIPFADFASVYGKGSMEATYLKQLPLDPEKIFAVAFATPHYPLAYVKTKHMIDDVSLVKVPGTDLDLRSYWQMSAATINSISFVKNPLLIERSGVVNQIVGNVSQ